MTDRHELVWNHAVEAEDYDTAVTVQGEISQDSTTLELDSSTPHRTMDLRGLSLDEFGRMMTQHLE